MSPPLRRRKIARQNFVKVFDEAVGQPPHNLLFVRADDDAGVRVGAGFWKALAHVARGVGEFVEGEEERVRDFAGARRERGWRGGAVDESGNDERGGVRAAPR